MHCKGRDRRGSAGPCGVVARARPQRRQNDAGRSGAARSDRGRRVADERRRFPRGLAPRRDVRRRRHGCRVLCGCRVARLRAKRRVGVERSRSRPAGPWSAVLVRGSGPRFWASSRFGETNSLRCWRDPCPPGARRAMRVPSSAGVDWRAAARGVPTAQPGWAGGNVNQRAAGAARAHRARVRGRARGQPPAVRPAPQHGA